ncbi:DUF397 domain-containing protein [Streptomyces olivochromogenes]|uniref:DUF397 domain-containing protein n=1 Tax=Streptomyces olivochromogenes TaxID=1963 RepID=UPI001F280029|nr:DUF397 domain-containing protein [Streptomyces olivochromogenes]MCF3133290.1 DUF397 domain-containing protein [Streptomyces olivochromogenes]
MIRKASAGDSTELEWFKSSYSDGPDGNSCIEIAPTPTTIHVRDSKHPTDAPHLTFPPTTWTTFVSYAAGE